MNKFQLSLAALLFIMATANAQSVSPLFQVMSSSSLINRPSAFRELQSSIESEYKDVKPGLNLDYLYSKMSDVRTQFLQKIVGPKLDLSPTKLNLSFGEKTVEIPFENNDHRKLFDALQIKIQEWIEDGINSIQFPATEKKAILASLLLAISTSELGRDVSVHLSPNDYIKELSRVVVAIVLRTIEEEIAGRVSPKVLNSGYTQDILNADLVKFFNEASIKVTKIIKDKLVIALGIAEHEVAKVLDQTSQGIISGNFGVAVTEGKGAFAGGLYILFTQKETFQLGMYVNGQLQKGDSTKPTESLVGAQTRLACDKTQLDILYSRLFGDKDFKLFHAGELGLGLSYRVNNDMIAGVAYFNLHAGKFSPLHIFGITFKGTSPEAPGLLLGANLQGTDVKPVFQISFPVLSAK